MGKYLRGYLFIAVLVFGIFVLTSCGSEDGGKESEDKLITDVTQDETGETAVDDASVDDTPVDDTSVEATLQLEEANTIGGTPGNIANGSFWGFQGNKLYYTANYDLGILDLETGELQKIKNAAGNSLQILGTHAYQSGLMGLNQVNLSTGEIKTLNPDFASSINAVDGWLYYVNSKDNKTVYRMDTNGENREKLSDLTDVSNLLFYEGKLYFNRYWNTWDIYKMDLDGSNLVMLQDKWIDFFTIHDGWIYFMDLSAEPEGIFKFDLNGGNKTRLTEVYGDFMNICGDYLFFQNSADGNKLYRMSLKGGDIEKVLDFSINYIHVYGDYLYFYHSQDPEYRVHRMHYDSNVPEPMNMPASIE